MEKQTNKKDEGLGLISVIWIGFNFIAGITFASAFSDLVWNGSTGVGLHLLWINVIEGAIAFTCAWAFAKLVRVHPSANGGLSQYSRTGFGKYWGLVGGLLNYMSLPLIVSTMVVSTFRTNFGAGSTVDLLSKWGDWSTLYLDLLGFAVFILSMGIVFLGVKKYKYFSNIVGILGWILTATIIIFALGAFIINGSSSINYLAKYAPISNVDGKSFAKTFVSIFFSFAGIETFITSGQTIKDRSKNMPIGMAVIMILVTAFYVIFTLLVMGACAVDHSFKLDGFGGNGAITLFHTWDSHFDTGDSFRNAGAWMVIVVTLVMRFNALVNINMFGGLTLEPLAHQGFVSHKISEPSKRTGLPTKALLITMAVYIATIILFLFVPDIIQGTTHEESPFSYAILASVSSIVMIAIYVLALTTCLKQYFAKQLKLHIVEVIAFIAVLCFMGFLIVMYFWTSVADNYKAGTTQSIVSATVQLLFILAIAGVSLGLYFGFHKKYIKYVEENEPERFKEMEEYAAKTYRIVEPEEDGGIFKRHAHQKQVADTKQDRVKVEE